MCLTYDQAVAALAWNLPRMTDEQRDGQIDQLAEQHGQTPFAVEADLTRHLLDLYPPEDDDYDLWF